MHISKEKLQQIADINTLTVPLFSMGDIENFVDLDPEADPVELLQHHVDRVSRELKVLLQEIRNIAMDDDNIPPKAAAKLCDYKEADLSPLGLTHVIIASHPQWQLMDTSPFIRMFTGYKGCNKR